MPIERAGLSSVEIPDLSSLHTPLRPGRLRGRVEADSSEPVRSFEIPYKEETQQDLVRGPAPIAEKPGQTLPVSAPIYPSLAAAPREHLIPYSIRLPLSQVEALDRLCRSRNIDKSNLVRDFIAAGLKSLENELAALK